MILKSVSARFESGMVLFDEVVNIPPQARLLVTILEDEDTDRTDFMRLSSVAFAGAFDDDEMEYSEADLRR